MSSSWKQYGRINHLENSRYGTLVADNLILKNGYNGDLNINGNLNVGNINAYNININNLLVINGNIISNKTSTFNGNVILNGNTLVNGNIIFNNNLNTNGDIGIGGNILIGQNATINGNIFIPPNFIISDISGIGINTSPIATLDICGNNIQSLNVYSNNPSTFNVIAQNDTNKGILLTANTISTSIQFFNDNPINYTTPFANNFDSQIKYNIGGNLEIDTSNNLTIASKLTVIPNNIYKINQDIIKHSPLAETTTIYDISSGIYLPSIYNNSTENTGNALTLLATDSFSNTFLHIKTQTTYKGISIGGGAYPLDQTRSMGTIGYTDISTNQHNTSQIIISGNNNIHNTTTIGINNYQPITEKYTLDINGETKIHTGDLRYITSPFCVYSLSSFAGNIIGIGGYVLENSVFKHYAYSSINGGNTWNSYTLNGLGDIDSTTNIFNYVFYYNSTVAFIVGQTGFKGFTNDNGINWHPYALTYNSLILTFNATSFYAYAKDSLTTRCFISYSDLTDLTIPSFYFDILNSSIYNNTIITINVTSNAIGTVRQIKSLSANTTTLFLLSENISGNSYLYSASLASPTTTTTLATYNSSTFIPNAIVASGSFLAVGGSYGIYSSHDYGNTFTFTDLSTITINSFAIYSNTQCVALGTNGYMCYTINAGINWTQISTEILNSAGTYGYLQNSIFNNINSATFTDANTLIFNGYNASNQSNSNIYSLYAPNLFNTNYNNVLDISGSVCVSGSVNINDGGFLDSNNSTFYLLNSPTDTIYFGKNTPYLFVGNTLNKGLTTINNDSIFLGNLTVNGILSLTGGSSITIDTSNSGITTYTNLTIADRLRTGAIIIYGGCSIDGNLFLGGNLITYGNSYVGGDLYVKGNIVNSNFGNVYVYNSISIGSSNTIPPNYKLQVNGNANISTTLFVNGNIGIGKSNPGFSLDVSGIVNSTGLYVNGVPYIGSQWTTTQGNIYYITGNVGIGTNTPSYTLDVNGNIHTTGNAIISGNVGIGKSNPGFSLDVSGIVNATGLYVNGIRYVESQWTTTQGNIYYITGNVGIGTNTPSYNLDVNGNVRVNTINPIMLGNIGTQLYGVDLGFGDTNRSTSNSGKIMYGPNSIDGNSLVIIGKGTNTSNRNIDLFDNVNITGNLTINSAINAYTTKTINGTPYTGLVIQKTNTADATFNLSLIATFNSTTSKRILGFNSYASSGVNNGITQGGDHQIIYTHDITSGGLTNCGLTIAPYDVNINVSGINTNVSGIRLDSNGFLGICKSASTYSAPLDVGKSGGLTGIQTRTIQGIETNNSAQILHIIQPASTDPIPLSNVGYFSIYNLNTSTTYDISAGLSIGWSSYTATNINTGTSDFLNWGNKYNGGYSFHTINNVKNFTPKILLYIDASDNKTSINKYPVYTEFNATPPYLPILDVSGSGRFVQDCSSLIVKCYNRSSAQSTGTRIIFDTDGLSGTTYSSFPYTYISAIQDVSGSATLNFATGNQTRMTISNLGLVGIGTNVPAYNLDVTGNARFTTTVTIGGTLTSDTGDLLIVPSGTRNLFLNSLKGSTTGDVFINYTSTASNTYISNGGLAVNKGTLTSGYNFDVSGSAIVSGSLTTGSITSTSTSDSNFYLNNSNTNGTLSLYSTGTTWLRLGVSGTQYCGIYCQANGNMTFMLLTASKSFVFGNSAYDSICLINESGITLYGSRSIFLSGSIYLNNNGNTIYIGGGSCKIVGFINEIQNYGRRVYWINHTNNQVMMVLNGGELNATGTYNLDVYGPVSAPSFNATSDYRIKENISHIDDTIDNLKPVKYFNKLTNKPDIGFIAHELAEEFPYLVNGNKDDLDEKGQPNYQSINYTSIIPLLVKEVQDIKKNYALLDTENKNLSASLQELKVQNKRFYYLIFALLFITFITSIINITL